jgi:magnesium chelatase family protein
MGMVLDGIRASLVTLEARVSESLRPHEVRVVGMPETSVKEGMQRARAAVWPIIGGVARQAPHGVLVNLSPADVRKAGRSLDLPLAMVYACLHLGLGADEIRPVLLAGEVGLGGEVRGVPGVLAAAMAARVRCGFGLAVATGDLAEASLIDGVPLYGVDTVGEALEVLRGRREPAALARGLPLGPRPEAAVDLAEIRGQWEARRALEIAAAGGHNLLLEGPPGAGKTMLARRLPTILPPLSDSEALEVALIQSASRSLRPERLLEPPFRTPHHTASTAGLTGGGSPIRPGEFSRAHRGVLFLDELPEFDRRALEALREPLEERVVHVTRAGTEACFPADFLCVAAMNPCPCGYALARDGRCTCSPRAVATYRARVSGPLLDRFDMRVVLKPLPAEALFEIGEGETSAVVRARVIAARAAMRARHGPEGPSTNARAPDRSIRSMNRYGPAERETLVELMTRHGISARGTRRLERVARTIADLEASLEVRRRHLVEAAHFRLGDGGSAVPGFPAGSASLRSRE